MEGGLGGLLGEYYSDEEAVDELAQASGALWSCKCCHFGELWLS